jgi:hypothetical protein
MSPGGDWSATLLFAGIALLEGIREVPAGGVVLRSLGTGPWRPAPQRPGLRLVSWWAPATRTVVLRPSPLAAVPVPADHPLRQLGAWPAVLDSLGGITLLSLVLGLPAAARWWTGWGFVAGLAAVLLLSGATATASAIAAGRTGATGFARVRFGLPFLNPFAAGRAGEALRERALAWLTPLEAARHLLQPERFADWLRPRVYDCLSGASAGDPELDRLLSRDAQAALLAARPADARPDEPWCARCGALFQSMVHTCPDCGVPLEPTLAA